MSSKFGFLSKLNFLQSFLSSFIARTNPAIIHNVEKYYALKKVHYLTSIENLEGDYLEFGVYTGSSFTHSIRCYKKSAKLVADRQPMRFWGFDSFEGFGDLPEDDKHPFYLDNNFSTSYEKVNKRTRKVAKAIPYKLLKGFFEETAGKKDAAYYGIKKASILFIDSDTYSSSKIAFEFCKPIIQTGMYIILDDFFSYKGSLRKGVCGAFNEFCKETGIITRQVLNYGMGGAVFVIAEIKDKGEDRSLVAAEMETVK